MTRSNWILTCSLISSLAYVGYLKVTFADRSIDFLLQAFLNGDEDIILMADQKAYQTFRPQFDQIYQDMGISYDPESNTISELLRPIMYLVEELAEDETSTDLGHVSILLVLQISTNRFANIS